MSTNQTTQNSYSDSHKAFIFDQLKQTDYNTVVEMIPIGSLRPMDDQPRKHFEQEPLEELASSIKTYGILQPLIISTNEKNELCIIAGERRWRAAQLLGLTEIPCIRRDVNEHSKLEIALIENIQRENLSPIEEATSLKRLIDEHDYTQEVLANRIGKSRSAIANALRLLNLPEKIVQDLNAKVISAGHGKALCSLNDTKLQLKAYQIIINKKLSVRQTEELVKNFKKEKEPKKLIDSISPDLRYICDQFKGHLGTKVKIAGDTHRGKIEISYYTMDDLERISELILGNFGLGDKQ